MGSVDGGSVGRDNVEVLPRKHLVGGCCTFVGDVEGQNAKLLKVVWRVLSA